MARATPAPAPPRFRTDLLVAPPSCARVGRWRQSFFGLGVLQDTVRRTASTRKRPVCSTTRSNATDCWTARPRELGAALEHEGRARQRDLRLPRDLPQPSSTPLRPWLPPVPVARFQQLESTESGLPQGIRRTGSGSPGQVDFPFQRPPLLRTIRRGHHDGRGPAGVPGQGARRQIGA